jgi:hypothetical protein
MNTRRTFPFTLAGLILLASWPLARPCAADAPTLALRAGIVSPGPQGTLEQGIDMGAAVEWPVFPGALGLELSWAQDGKNDLELLYGGINARWNLSRSPTFPYLELGLGAGHFDTPADETTPFVGWFGLGVSVPAAEEWRVRFDARYHYFASDFGGMDSGGNLEDFFSFGLTLARGSIGSR